MFSIRWCFTRYLSTTVAKKSIDWATSDTNGLVKQLSARIKSGGPITVADFMRESLLNPNYVGYLLKEILFFPVDFLLSISKLVERKICLLSLFFLGLLHTA
jgi:hypothetical protein